MFVLHRAARDLMFTVNIKQRLSNIIWAQRLDAGGWFIIAPTAPNYCALNCRPSIDEESLTWTSQDDVEIQTIDTDRWVVFDAQIDVFLNTEAEVSVLWEIFTSQLVFSDLKQIKQLRN